MPHTKLINDHLIEVVKNDVYAEYSKNALSYFNNDLESMRRLVRHAAIGITIAILCAGTLYLWRARYIPCRWLMLPRLCSTGALVAVLCFLYYRRPGSQNAKQSVI